MKCPHCGFWNRAQYPKCFQCGYPLDGETQVPFQPQNSVIEPISEPEGQVGISQSTVPYVAPSSVHSQADSLSASLDQEELTSDSFPVLSDFPGDLRREFPVRKAPIHIHGKPMEVLEHENIIVRNPQQHHAPTESRSFLRPRHKQKALPAPTKQIETKQYYDPSEPITATYPLAVHPSLSLAKRPQRTHTNQSRSAKDGLAPVYTMQTKRRKLFWLAFLKLVFAFVFLLVLCIGGYMLFTKISTSSFGKSQQTSSKVAADYTIQEIEKNKKSAHEIVFTSDRYESVYIEELQSTYLFTLGEAQLMIYDETVIGEKPQESTIHVTLTPTFYLPSGAQEKGEPIGYDLDVPTSEITLLSPQTSYSQTQTPMTSIKFSITPGSYVSVQGVDVSDFADTNGVVVQNVDTTLFGDNDVTIIVQTPGHISKTTVLTLNRPYMDILIELEPTTPTTSSSKTVELKGTTLPGASITVDSGQSSEPATVKSDGSFSIKVNLSKIGENEIKLKASMTGKQNSYYTLTVAYAPKLDEYSKQAWPMDAQNINDIRAMPSAKVGKIYVGTGTVTAVSEDTLPIYTFELASGTSVYIQMVEGKNLEQGKRYKIFCDFDSMQDEFPLFIGRYFFDQ